MLSLRRQLSLVALASILALVLLEAFPQIIFAHGTTVSGIRLYSTRPIPAQTSDTLRAAAELVSHSEIFAPGRVVHVFVPAHPWVARVFNPASDGFAFHVAITGNIFVTQGDLATNSAKNESAIHNRRMLSAVIAHEITHDLIFAKFGTIRGLSIPTWVSEGYCDYIAREGSFPEQEGMALLKKGGNDSSISFQYFLYRHAIAHLIEDRHISLQDIVHLSETSNSLFQDAIREVRERERTRS